MSLDTKTSFLKNRRAELLFSSVFAFILPISVVIIPYCMLLFNIIYFPFSLIHELGHLLTTIFLLPSLNPLIKFELVRGELKCICVVYDSFPCCWPSVVSMIAGTSSVVLAVVGVNFVLSRNLSTTIYVPCKKILGFGLLADLPNAFPISPSNLGSITDGYAAYTYLHQMGYLPLLQSSLSTFFSLISVIIVLVSFYYLGSFLYHIGLLIIRKYENQ